MFVIIEIDRGYDGDADCIGRVYGPFPSEQEAEAQIADRPDFYNYQIHELFS